MSSNDRDCWDWVILLAVLAATVGVLVSLFFSPPPVEPFF
jgi:hypothetical protein